MVPNLEIPLETLQSIRNQVVLITGGSSGIGRPTASLCLEFGAKVIIGDINPPLARDFLPEDNLKFIKTDTTSWESMLDLFDSAKATFGYIDHVFANAGISSRTNFLDEGNIDEETGCLAAPDLEVLNINLIGVIYTLQLAVHHFREVEKDRFPDSSSTARGRSIVLTASASSFQNFSAPDYTAAKHGVLGLMRGLVDPLSSSSSSSDRIRINSVAPSWTSSGLVSGDFFAEMGLVAQSPDVVARSVVLLFVDVERNGDLIYSWEGKYKEINNVEGGLLSSARNILGNEISEEEVFQRIQKGMEQKGE